MTSLSVKILCPYFLCLWESSVVRTGEMGALLPFSDILTPTLFSFNVFMFMAL